MTSRVAPRTERRGKRGDGKEKVYTRKDIFFFGGGGVYD